MIFGSVRTKAGEAHPKRLLKFLLPIFIGFLVSIIGQSSMPPIANALYFGTGYNAAVAGNAGGGNQNGVNACATDMVAVGVGLTVNGSSPGFGIYCRAIGPDGQLVAQDQSSATNTTVVYGGNNKVFCPAGQVVTGISFIIWSNVAIRCATPPTLSDNSALIWYTTTSSNPASTNCSTGGVVAGFFTRTGAWIDAIGAYCLPFKLNTLSYNVNGGSGTAPASQTQTVPGQLLVTASTYAGTRTGFHLDGWNTLANGLGDDYAIGSNIRPVGATTLYAKWTSTITYNGNTNTAGSVPNPTTAVSSAAVTQLAPNNGSSRNPMVPLAKTGFTFAGWNTLADGTGTFYAAGETNYQSAGSVTLYAQWNSTITYNANGATGGTAPTATTAKGSAANTTLQSQGTILRTNFKFAGWNTLADGTGTFYAAGETNYQSAGSVTLYAQWTASTGTPTLATESDLGTSNSDKLTSDNTPTINAGTLVSGAVVTITATPASGSPITCTFTANSTSGSCTFTTLSDGTYSFTVSQSYNGGESTASTALAGVVIDTVRPTVSLTSTAILSGGNSLATPAAPSQNYNINAIFSKVVSGFVIGEITKNSESTGWAISTTALSTSALSSYIFNVVNATGAGNAAGKLFLSIAEGVATDAAGNTNAATTSSFIINTVIQLTLTNQYQSGISPVVGGNNATVVQSSNGASVDLTGQGGVTRANHTFAGWSLVTTNGSGAVIPSPFIPTMPLFLYSSWTANVFVVSFNANGGNGAPTNATVNYTFGTAGLAINSSYNVGTLLRTGYTFAGWSTTTTGSDVATTYVPTASTILYARWTAGSNTVAFNNNGGTGTMTSQTIISGTATTLTTNSFLRTGYTFAGWNTLADGTGTNYSNSASVTLFAGTTLFARWTPITPGVPTIAISGVVGNTQITVAVTEATLSGTAGPAKSYLVTASPGSATCTIIVPATTCTITGLTNGTAYTFKAAATNATGSSAASAASASATPAPFLVTYAANSGTVSPATANFNLGTPVVLPLPTRTGYNFTGWNNPSSTTVGINGASYSPTAAITLTAQWNAITYTVTYNGNGSNGGALPANSSFAFGNSFTIDAKGTITKSGYNFAGWTTAADGTGTLYANASDSIASSAATYSASANLVLYAKWTPQVYTITYDKNGATGNPSRVTDSFTFGTTALTLPTITGMTYTNYTFGGWSESTTGLAVVSPYSPTQTRTLYAVWSGISYSVSFNVNGGTGSVADATYTTGATGLTLSNGSGLTRVGYNFGGWKNLAGTTVSGSLYAPTANVTLYAIWTAKTIVVTYDKGVATVNPTTFPSSPANATFGTNFTLGTTDTSTVISSNNYAFAGWKIGDVTYKPGDSYGISSESPFTVTAQWIRLFEVTYNTNGGTFAGGDGVNDSQCVSTLCTDGQVIQVNLAPTRTGFTFVQWVSQTGANFAAGATTTVTATNYVFYAIWTANSYTISFAAGASTTNGSAAAITDSHGVTVQLRESTGYALTGSVFTGWLIGSITYPAGAFYVMGTDASPITATAQYANNTFKVFYNLNGATSGTAAATTAITGAAITLSNASGVERTGFTFEGWSDGTNVRAASFATTMGSANSTVIAQWKIAIPVAPVIASVAGTSGGATVTVSTGSGGGSPTSYTVTASPGGGSCTIIAPATSCSISPLTNGTAYTFAVTATNSTGTSAATTSGAVTPAGAPDAPTGVSATAGNGAATVTFVAPASTGGPAITGYTVTSSPAGGTCVVTVATLTAAFTGLTNGTAYTFTVTATNGTFTSAASTSSLAVTPATVPGAPTSVTATSGASGVATVSFTAPASNGGSAITGYVVTSSPAGAICVVGANATTYSCTGLTNGTAYTFAVVASNAIGNSVSGVSATALTPQGAASAVTTISAVRADSSAVVTFSGAVANGSTITGYTVQAYDSSGSAVTGATCTVTTAATSGSCTITGLTNGSQYTFKAVTNSTANSSSASSVASIATSAITPAKAPEAPTGVTTTAGTGKITVGWSVPDDNGSPITSYTVTSSPGGFTCTVLAPTTTCDVSTGLVAGTAYTFTVTATSAAGTSLASTASTSSSINAAPSAPRNVTAIKGNTTATVSWDAPLDSRGSDVTGYTATAFTSGNVVAGTCTTVAPTETCIVTGLTNGTPYTFRVTATNGIGTSAQSTASSAATPSTVPNAPTGVTAASGDAQATITFTAPTNNGGSAVTGYTVTASNGSTISGTTSPLRLTGLTNGTAYTFTVKATNINGDSVASSASSASTPVASSDPVLVPPAQSTGNPYVGSTLTSNVIFSGSPAPSITYQWKVCTDSADLTTCTNITGATTITFVPTITELDKYIVVLATATNTGGTASQISDPTLVIKPEIVFTAPSPVPGATAGTAYVLSTAAAGGVGTFAYTVSNGTLPAGLTLDPATGQIAGTPTTAGTYTFTVRATDSNGVYKDVVVTIVVAGAPSTGAPSTGAPATPAPATPAPATPAPVDRTAADRAAAEALAKATADKAVADAAVAAKIQSDAAATTASINANAAAAATAAAAKAAVEKAVAAETAKIAADTAVKAATDKAKAASDAQAAANKAAAEAAAALRNPTTTVAAKAEATKAANNAVAAATAAVNAAAAAAQQAAAAKNTATNANKQVEIAISALSSKTAASQTSAQANAVAAAAKAAANEAAAAAAARATEAKALASAAQQTAVVTAARIATEQKEAATAAALSKVAADAAAKATAERITATNAAKIAAEALVKVLDEKAALAVQAAKAIDQAARTEIQKKIEAVDSKVTEVQKTSEEATSKADTATAAQETAVKNADTAKAEAEVQSAEAVAVKSESAIQTAAASKATADATVAAKVATAAGAAAAKVPSKAVIATKPSTSTNKNSATVTVTGLKPGQKVKVTVNVKPKP